MARKLQREAQELSELFSGSAVSHRFTKASYADGTVEMSFDDLKKLQAGLPTWHTHRLCVDRDICQDSLPHLSTCGASVTVCIMRGRGRRSPCINSAVSDKTVSCTAYTIAEHPASRNNLRGETDIGCCACDAEATRSTNLKTRHILHSHHERQSCMRRWCTSRWMRTQQAQHC